MTNGDKIRQMSDEELFHMLRFYTDECVCCVHYGESCAICIKD